MNDADNPRSAQDSLRDQLVAAAQREPDPSRTAQTGLRDALVAAAVREYGAAPARPRRRRRRRAVGLAVVALLGAAAVADATGLISVGDPIEPAPGVRAGDPRITANLKGTELVATAPDPDRKLAWGVGVYTSGDGSDCVIAGQVRGNELGMERDGTFRPYSDLRPGACGDLGRLPRVLEFLMVGGAAPRTIVFGRSARTDDAGTLRLKPTGERFRIEPAAGGGFLFVFNGRYRTEDFAIDE